jgi:hypothetical protein
MTAALLALAAAILTAVAYGTMTEQLDYATVRRRQLDAWAALSAFACLSGILYGGAEVQREVAARAESTAAYTVTAGAPEATVARREGAAAPLGAQAVATEALSPAEPGPLAAAPESVAAPPPGVPAVDEPVAGVAPVAVEGPAGTRPEPAGSGAPSPTAAVPAHLDVSTLAPPTATATAAPPSPTATSHRVSVAPTATSVRDGVATLPPRPRPTEPAPTDLPPPPPSSTPHCGDPGAIRVVVERIDTSADRGGERLVASLTALVRNDSPFPVTLSSIRISAVNSDSGSEQYGSSTLPDTTIQPGARYELEAAVALTKRPPPFGSTELCLQFEPESCGAGNDRFRRCQPVDGLY